MPTIGGLWTVSPYPPRTRCVPKKAAPGSRTWVQALACRGLCPALPAPCPCQGGSNPQDRATLPAPPCQSGLAGGSFSTVRSRSATAGRLRWAAI